MSLVKKAALQECGSRVAFLDLSGRFLDQESESPIAVLTKGRRNFALQESANLGSASFFSPVPGMKLWILALEDHRMVLGGMVGGEAILDDGEDVRARIASFLEAGGVGRKSAQAYVSDLPRWTEARVEDVIGSASKLFYQVSGWKPLLMEENRLRVRQKEQLQAAIEERRNRGEPSLYAFDKERLLLANIRAGDRNEARRILNDMLAVIYLSSQRLSVLRARTIELLSCISRAAIEDNPLLEPMIERNHEWTERLVKAGSFEELSRELMTALDEFIEGIYLHRANRASEKVRGVLDYLSRHSARRVTLGEVAREAGVSAYRIAHLIKQHTGRTMLENLFEIRIRHAQHLLEKSNRSCAEIAYETGFGDQSYFTYQFRKLTGITPARYRRKMSGE